MVKAGEFWGARCGGRRGEADQVAGSTYNRLPVDRRRNAFLGRFSLGRNPHRLSDLLGDFCVVVEEETIVS